MGWKTIKGRCYFYEWVDVSGQRVRRCCGSGHEAEVAAGRVALERVRREDELAVVHRWEIEDAEEDRLSAIAHRLVWREVQLTLRAGGYHFVKRKWKKMQAKTMRAGAPADLSGETLIGAEEGLLLETELRRLSLEGLRRSGLGSELDEVQLAEINAEILAKVEAMREEFRYESCSAIEKMLVEQIITAWVQWYVASWQLETLGIDDDNLKKSRYLETRYFRYQQRLSRSLEQLARVRCVPRVYLMGCKR